MMDALRATPLPAPRSNFRFRCSQCDEIHVGLPDICFPTPHTAAEMSDDDFARDCLISSDFCIIKGSEYYIHCVLEVPVADYPDRFGWGVWCRTDWQTFKYYWETTEHDLGEILEAVDARLANNLHHMPPTDDLPCRIHFRGNDLRPLVVIEPCDHELFALQQDGLTIDQAVAHAQSIGTLLLVA